MAWFLPSAFQNLDSSSLSSLPIQETVIHTLHHLHKTRLLAASWSRNRKEKKKVNMYDFTRSELPLFVLCISLSLSPFFSFLCLSLSVSVFRCLCLACGSGFSLVVVFGCCTRCSWSVYLHSKNLLYRLALSHRRLAIVIVVVAIIIVSGVVNVLEWGQG